MKKSTAEIIREYGPFPGVTNVHGVSYDGARVWFASGDRLNALDPESGNTVRTHEMTAVAGTAFDGMHIFQIADDRIQKIDPQSGKVLNTIPAPPEGAAGMAWAEGSLWVGQHRNKRILQIDPETGRILRAIECKRRVTGVTWVEGDLWHGTWEDEQSDLRRIDAKSGEVLEQIDMPPGLVVSGLEAGGKDRFYCGGGPSGTIRVVKRPKKG